MTVEFPERIGRYTIIVVDDPTIPFPVPREVAVCPDCEAGLSASPYELEIVTPGIDLWKVFVPTLYCQSDKCRGDQMTSNGTTPTRLSLIGSKRF